eukprot:scpid108628/ scgid20694/ 
MLLGLAGTAIMNVCFTECFQSSWEGSMKQRLLDITCTVFASRHTTSVKVEMLFCLFPPLFNKLLEVLKPHFTIQTDYKNVIAMTCCVASVPVGPLQQVNAFPAAHSMLSSFQ